MEHLSRARMRLVPLLSCLLFFVSVTAAKASAVSPMRRELRRRTLLITDASVHSVAEVHVARGTPTTLVFQVPLRENGVLLADVGGHFYPAQVSERTLIVIPRRDVPRQDITTLTVTLEDGTVLPFTLRTLRRQVDLQIDVQVALDKRAAPDSAPALKALSTQLRAQLDECKASSGAAGVTKLAALILAQDPAKPQAFNVQRHSVHYVDKQSRLWVEVTQVYRLFDLTYAVLTIQNRDPAKAWVLDRPEVALRGGGEGAELRVVSFTSDMASLAPDESAKVVVAFASPARGVGQEVVLSLLEKNGNRHFKVEGLAL